MASTLFYGLLRDGVPNDENTVRATTAPVDPNALAAAQDHTPVIEEVTTDSDSNLSGIATRQKASYWHESEQYTPSWLANASDQSRFTLVNEQVASSGTAAAREEAGQFGHGTMRYAVGIEPVFDLADNGARKLGNDYFTRNERGPQDTASTTMMSVPPGYDHSDTISSIADGKTNAREASQAAMYAAWFQAVNG